MAEDVKIIVELDKKDVDAFRSLAADEGVNVEISEEEQFFGDSSLAMGILHVAPHVIGILSALLSAFGKKRHIIVNIDGKSLTSSELNETQLRDALTRSLQR
jgi:hypothetical protein